MGSTLCDNLYMWPSHQSQRESRSTRAKLHPFHLNVNVCLQDKYLNMRALQPNSQLYTQNLSWPCFEAKATCVMFLSWIIAMMQNFTYQLMEIYWVVLTAIWGYSVKLLMTENLSQSFHTPINSCNSTDFTVNTRIYRQRSLPPATKASGSKLTYFELRATNNINLNPLANTTKFPN